MSDKYSSLSPYVYCADNPVKLVDPNGEEYWKPDEEGNLIAEEGDNYESLSALLNCSYHKSKKLLASQGYERGIREGDKVMLNNPYTRSINVGCEQRLTDAQAYAYGQQWQNTGLSEDEMNSRLKELACPQDLYNCWSAAIAGSNNLEIGPNIHEIYTKEQFDESLDNKYPVNTDKLKFGKTILRFTKNGSCTHAAVYYGSDKNGTMYIYSKNGNYSKPFVMPLN